MTRAATVETYGDPAGGRHCLPEVMLLTRRLKGTEMPEPETMWGRGRAVA